MTFRWFTGVMAALLIAPATFAQDTEVEKPKNPIKDAAKKTRAAKSYAFKLEIEIESDFGNQMERPEIKGRYEEGEGLYLQIESDQFGSMEIVRIGKDVAIKRDGGDWEKFGARGGRRDGGGGGFGGGMGFDRMLSQLKAPHEELEDVEKNFKKIEKTDETERIGRQDATIWKGALTEKGAENSLPIKGILQWIPNADLEGVGKIWINEDGRAVKYEYETTIIGDFNGNEFEVTMVRTVELSDLGETKAEIPDEAKDVLKKKDEEQEKKDQE